MVSGFGLKPPAFGFQSFFFFTVVSRLLLLYCPIDKSSRLKMKSFSTLRDTQRLHGEEKREGVVRGGWNEMRWDQKRREQASQ